MPGFLASPALPFVPIILLSVLFLLHIGRFFFARMEEMTRLEILAPLDGSTVDLLREVRGAVHPPNRPVQVFVYSRDNLWYPQSDPEVDGRAWSAKCQFGNERSGQGSQFQVVALSSNQKVREPVSRLPRRARKSPVAHVQRK